MPALPAQPAAASGAAGGAPGGGPRRTPEEWAGRADAGAGSADAPAGGQPPGDGGRGGAGWSGRRADPWDRPAAQGRPDDWDRLAGTASPGGDDRPAAGGWETVLPPVGGAPPRQDRTEDRGAAGVDEATTFMSQWGPPPLRSTEEREAAPGWAGPGAPPRAGAGRSDNPGERPRPAPPRPAPPRPAAPRPGPGVAAPLPPVAAAPAPPANPTGSAGTDPPGVERAPTEPAAERWIADRLAADRAEAADRTEAAGAAPVTGDDRFTGYWSTDRRPGADPRQAAREQPVDDGFAGYWVRERPARRPTDGAEADSGGQPVAGGPGDGQRPAEVTGPLGVGAWSREGAAAPARPRGRQRAEQPEPIERHPDDRTPPGPGGGGGGEPPHRGGGGGRGEPERGRRTVGDRIRAVVRGIGQTFITLGLVLLLLAAYEVWFTDVLNHRTQKHLTTALQKQWEQGGDDPTVTTPARPGQKVRSIPLGDAFALIYIPDFGTDYVFSVVQGTGLDELNEGPGHYVDTPLPGAVGNMAIAGHRVGKGSPFLNLDKLAAGSAIVLRTKSYWYTYRVVGDASGDADGVSALGFPGREVVDPTDVGVIAPVPDKPGARPTRRLLTLTTCHPKFTARQRMVIHAQLAGAPFPVSKGTPPSMTGA